MAEEKVHPTEDEPFITRARRPDRVFHTRRCIVVKKTDQSNLVPLSSTIRNPDDYSECELCADNFDRTDQHSSFAKKIRSNQFRVVEDEDASLDELGVSIERVEESN